MLNVQRALGQAGVNGELFNGHSFRIGAATSANQAGIPETMIRFWVGGRVRPTKATFSRQPQHWQLAISSRMASAPKV